MQDITSIRFQPRDVVDGRWRIERQIGQGAMGTVFLAEDVTTRRKVAIKILSPELCDNPRLVARFEREIRLMAAVRHPNVIQLHAVGRRGPFQFVVMEYLAGATLAAVLAKVKRLGPREALAVLGPVCVGLESLHAEGLVHRDLKPANIFIARDGHVTILDLGLALRPTDPGLTRPGARVGTPWYMSPEQASGRDDNIDARADIYALGVLTFQLFTGRPPFDDPNPHDAVRAHLQSAPPDPRTLNPSLPRAAAVVIGRALEKRPEDRFPTVSAFLGALEAAFTATEPMKVGGDPMQDEAFTGPTTLVERDSVSLGRYASEVLGPPSADEEGQAPERPGLLEQAAAMLRRWRRGARGRS